jgi:hypothetical protein
MLHTLKSRSLFQRASVMKGATRNLPNNDCDRATLSIFINEFFANGCVVITSQANKAIKSWSPIIRYGADNLELVTI